MIGVKTMDKRYWLVWKYPKKHIIDFIAPFNAQQSAIDSMYGWWQKNDYEPPYVRISESKATYLNDYTFDALWIDYGSHHMFYEVWEIPYGFEPIRLHLGCALKNNKGKFSRFNSIKFIDSLYLKILMQDGAVVQGKNELLFNSSYGKQLTASVMARDLIRERQLSAYTCMHLYQEKKQ